MVNNKKTKNDEVKKRGRGRPRKIKTADSKKIEIESDESDIENEKLILHLPISSKKTKDTILSSRYISDDNEETDDEEDDDDIKSLRKKIKILKKMLEEQKKQINDIKYKENMKSSVKEYKIVDNVKVLTKEGEKFNSKKSNMPCWWDGQKFNTYPWYLPDRYNEKKKCYYGIGPFCSPECALAYNEELNDTRIEIRRVLLHKYVSDTTGEDVKIEPALKREVYFGGVYTLEQFRDKNTFYKKKIKTKIPPVIPLITQVEIANDD